MRNVLTITMREIRSYFVAPIAYSIYMIFLLVSGWFFTNILAFFVIQSIQSLRFPWLAERINIHDLVIRPFYGNMSVILLLMVPVITMRLFSEEKKLGTSELLYTSPIKIWQIVVGKYFSSVIFLLVMLLLTVHFPIFLFAFGEPQVGVVLSTYLGVFLMGASFCAVGLLASSLTENQVIAAIVAFGVLLLFWVIGWASESVGGVLKSVLQHLSLLEHQINLSKGIFDLRDILFYLSFITFTLFITYGVVESRRWKGIT